MSQWVDDSNPGTPQSASTGETGTSSPQGAQPATPVRFPIWVRVIPFFLSSFLFLSGIFSIFAPLPILLLFFHTNRKWAWLAALTNTVLVYVAGGPSAIHFFAVFVLSISLSLPELLLKKNSLEKSCSLVLLILGMVATLMVAGYAQLHHVNPFFELKNQVSGMVDYMIQNLSPESREQWMGTAEPAEWKHKMLVEIPSAVGMIALALVWINLTLVLRLNPRRIREHLGIDNRYLQNWKSPEYLVWPTILAGFLLLADIGWPTDVALNVFKFLMAVYAIQGLAILSFMFDVWNIRGFFRTLAYVVAVFLMMPLLLSVGFFDQWFDFRSKFRQS